MEKPKSVIYVNTENVLNNGSNHLDITCEKFPSSHHGVKQEIIKSKSLSESLDDILSERNRLFAENTQLLNDKEELNAIIDDIQKIHQSLLSKFNAVHKQQNELSKEGYRGQKEYAQYAVSILSQILQ